ncbi:MAG TPA: BACON domain-containing carbohydrate-binding protein, partial [Acidobacteriaceae bacterium]|nr:BACON domain-containing carbohydrate-binding protein [Acidobacteriaceae bacterium]
MTFALVLAVLAALGPARASGQIPADALGTNALTLGGGATTSSVLVRASGPWTATANASWLHVAAGSSSGSGNANVVFSLDAMSVSGSRVGTLTIDGMTLTVTQAGANYTASGTSVAGPSLSMGPVSIAVDSAGNQYIAGDIWGFSCNSNGTLCGQAIIKDGLLQRVDATTKAVTTLGSGLNGAGGVAVDSAGNVYVADIGNNAIKKWTAATQQFTTFLSGLNGPHGVAVDAAGNVYFGDTGNYALKKWTAATQQVTTLYPVQYIAAVAVDILGNVYFSDADQAPYGWNINAGSNGSIQKWDPSTQQVATLFSLKNPGAINVDGSGNVYFMDAFAYDPSSGFFEYNPGMWSAATGQVTWLQNQYASGANSFIPLDHGIAVDSSGNVYVGAHDYYKEFELPYAQVPSGTINEPIAAGSDTLPPVLPITADLNAYSPQSDQSWLTLGTVTNDAVPFSLTANTTGAVRTA